MVKIYALKNYSISNDKKKDGFRPSSLRLIKYAFFEQTGESLNVDLIQHGKWGKPFFSELPWHFNISNSGDYSVIAWGNSPIGIDIQKLDIRMTIAERKFHKDEYALLMQSPLEDRKKIFTIIWAMKESYLKQSGRGISIPLDSFCANPLNLKISGSSLEFKLIDIDKEYICCACAQEQFEQGFELVI